MKKLLFTMGVLSLAFVACSTDEGSVTTGDNSTANGATVFNLLWNDSEATSSTTGTYIMTFTPEYLADNSNTITFSGAGYEIESTRTAYAYAVGGYLYNFSYGGGNFTKYTMPESDGSDDYAQSGSSIALGTATGNNNCRVSLPDDNTAAGHNIVTANESDDDGNYTTTTATLSYAFADLSSMMISSLGTGDVPTTVSYEDDGTEGTDVYVWRIHFPHKATVGSDEYLYYGVARRRLVASSLSTDSSYDATAAVMVVKNGDFDNIEIMEAPSFDGVRTIGQTYGYRSNPFCEYDGDIYHVTMNNLRILKIDGSTGKYDSSYDFDMMTALGSSVTSGDSGLDGTGIFYAGNGIAYVPYEDNNLVTDDSYKWGLACVNLNTKTAVAVDLPDNVNFWSYQNVGFADGMMYMALCPYGSTEGNIYVFDTTSATPEKYTLGANLVNGATGFYSSLF